MSEQVFSNRVGYFTVKIGLNFLRHYFYTSKNYFYIIVYRTYNHPQVVHSISHILVWSYSLGKIQLVNPFKFMSQQHII